MSCSLKAEHTGILDKDILDTVYFFLQYAVVRSGLPLLSLIAFLQ